MSGERACGGEGHVECPARSGLFSPGLGGPSREWVGYSLLSGSFGRFPKIAGKVVEIVGPPADSKGSIAVGGIQTSNTKVGNLGEIGAPKLNLGGFEKLGH